MGMLSPFSYISVASVNKKEMTKRPNCQEHFYEDDLSPLESSKRRGLGFRFMIFL